MDSRLIIYFFRSIFKRVSAGVFPRSLHQDASYYDRGIWWRYPGLADQDSPDTLSFFLTWLCIARSSPRETRDNLWLGHYIGTLKPMLWNVGVCCLSRAQKVNSALKAFHHYLVIYHGLFFLVQFCHKNEKLSRDNLCIGTLKPIYTLKSGCMMFIKCFGSKCSPSTT